MDFKSKISIQLGILPLGVAYIEAQKTVEKLGCCFDSSNQAVKPWQS